MGKQSAFAKTVQIAVAKRLGEYLKLQRQMGLDAAMIAANEVFNMGEGRCVAFRDAYERAMVEIAETTIEDGKTDKELWYTHEKIDRALKRICGKHFVPWEKRYGEVEK